MKILDDKGYVLSNDKLKEYLRRYMQRNHNQLSLQDRKRLVDGFIEQHVKHFGGTLAILEVKRELQEYIDKLAEDKYTYTLPIVYISIANYEMRCPHCSATIPSPTESFLWSWRDLQTERGQTSCCQCCRKQYLIHVPLEDPEVDNG